MLCSVTFKSWNSILVSMSLFPERSYNRVMVFVDYRNLMARYSEGNLTADLFRLTQILVGGRDLVGAYIFDGKRPGEPRKPEEQATLDRLRGIGFRLITREAMVWRNDHYEQKEVDVSLAVEMLEHALLNHYDIAILISGDRDYVPVVQKVQAAGKRVEVASYEEFLSNDRELQMVADIYHHLKVIPFISLSSPPLDGGVPYHE